MPLSWRQLRAQTLASEQNRNALGQAKTFAESWASELPELRAMVLHTASRRQLSAESLNRVIALAEQALDDQENPPRGGH